MASDNLLYLRSSDAAALAAAGYQSEAEGAWLRVSIDEPAQESARDLSARFSTAAVWCSLDSIAEQVWIVAFERGGRVRELRFADGKWHKSGKLAGEASALAKWLRVTELSAIPDGYDVLECVLGEDEPPVEEVDESRAAPAGWQAQALYFPSTLVAELAAAAERHGAPMSRVLCAAWQLGKHALYVGIGRRSLIGWSIQQVVDALGVGLDVPREAAEQLADGRRGLAREELEEDVVAVGDLDEEVRVGATAAGVIAARNRLDKDAGGIGGDTLRTRSAPSLDSFTIVMSSRSFAAGMPPSSPRSSSPMISRFAVTKASGVLISCAIPAASAPTDAMRSARRSLRSLTLRSVMSRTISEMPLG